MDDDEILTRIRALVDEERGLEGDDESGPERRERRRLLEEQLDQCWDLLRQRQARREFGQNPDEAHVRSKGNVEGYLQ